MFLCVLTRPQYIPREHRWFDGKIGMWPIGWYKPAAWASRNRLQGTIEFKSKNVTRDKYNQMLIVDLIPAILCKWLDSVWDGPPILIQQDGEPTHLKCDPATNLVNNPEWLQELADLGLQDRTILFTQPANSPDININNLGFLILCRQNTGGTIPGTQIMT